MPLMIRRELEDAIADAHIAMRHSRPNDMAYPYANHMFLTSNYSIFMTFFNTAISTYQRLIRHHGDLHDASRRVNPIEMEVTRNDFLEIREFHRWVKYQEAGLSSWGLSPGDAVGSGFTMHAINCVCVEEARYHAAKRVLWVRRQRDRGVGDPYEVVGRYEGMQRESRDAVTKKLPEQNRWLMDFSVVLPVETQELMQLVYSCDGHRRRGLHYIRKLKEAVSGPDGEMSEDWTQRAMVSEDKDCSICGYAYGMQYSEENETEPAVKTPCGHVFGKYCLDKWLDQHTTCPLCRHVLQGDVRATRRRDIKSAEEKIQQMTSKAAEMDQAVDKYFAASRPVHVGGINIMLLTRKYKELNDSALKTYLWAMRAYSRVALREEEDE